MVNKLKKVYFYQQTLRLGLSDYELIGLILVFNYLALFKLLFELNLNSLVVLFKLLDA